GPHELAGAGPPGEDVVAVGPDDQALDRGAAAAGDPAGEDVAEVAGGDGDLAGAGGRGGQHVVDDLGRHPGPVDRVHGRQADPPAQVLVGEQRLQQVLAVVEGALDRHVVHVGRVDGRHLPALHLGHPPGLVEHDDVQVGPTL